MDNINPMTYDEFLEKFVKKNKQWQFDLFSIICKKCGSDKVEFNSSLEVGQGYYDEIEREGELVVKCHGCGSGFSLDFRDLEPVE